MRSCWINCAASKQQLRQHSYASCSHFCLSDPSTLASTLHPHPLSPPRHGFYPPILSHDILAHLITRLWISPPSDVSFTIEETLHLFTSAVLCARPAGAPPLVAMPTDLAHAPPPPPKAPSRVAWSGPKGSRPDPAQVASNLLASSAAVAPPTTVALQSTPKSAMRSSSGAAHSSSPKGQRAGSAKPQARFEGRSTSDRGSMDESRFSASSELSQQRVTFSEHAEVIVEEEPSQEEVAVRAH